MESIQNNSMLTSNKTTSHEDPPLIDIDNREEFDDDFFEDEKTRKPKGKKIKKMRTSYDK